MKWFNNLKIGIKIISGFLLVAVIAGAIGIIGILGLNSVGNSYHAAYNDSAAAMSYVEKMDASFQTMRRDLIEIVLASYKTDKLTLIASLGDHRQTLAENLSNYESMLAARDAGEVTAEHELLAALHASMDAFNASADFFLEEYAHNASRRSEAFTKLSDGEELAALAQTVENDIANLVDYSIDNAAEQSARNSRLATQSKVAMLAGIVIGVLLAAMVGLYISRSLSRRIALLVAATDRLALGDVTVDVQSTSTDEIGQLAAAFARMAENTRAQALTAEKIAEGDLTVEVDIRSEDDLLGQKLHELIARNNESLSQIVAAAEQVNTGASQVAAGAQALAAGSTEQAASIEELSASADSVAGLTAENLNIIVAAAQYVDQAVSGVDAGNEHMRQLTDAMTDISAASGQIASITKVIEDIAFQTNILALNAAIEAARAGNAGKGFAVVADEVRSLAAKSAEAAKQTGELIQASVTTVARGSEVTAETAQILQEVGVSAGKVTESFHLIEQSSTEQAEAIGQIKAGIAQVSAVVQNNAATAEENSATSEEISAQAATLRQQVGKYKLSTDVQAAPAALPVYDPLPQAENALPESAESLGNLGKY